MITLGTIGYFLYLDFQERLAAIKKELNAGIIIQEEFYKKNGSNF